MSTINSTDLILVNRAGSSYKLEIGNWDDVLDSDIILVNRAGSSYQVTKANAQDIQDSDWLLINRAGSSYKVSGEDFKTEVISTSCPSWNLAFRGVDSASRSNYQILGVPFDRSKPYGLAATFGDIDSWYDVQTGANSSYYFIFNNVPVAATSVEVYQKGPSNLTVVIGNSYKTVPANEWYDCGPGQLTMMYAAATSPKPAGIKIDGVLLTDAGCSTSYAGNSSPTGDWTGTSVAPNLYTDCANTRDIFDGSFSTWMKGGAKGTANTYPSMIYFYNLPTITNKLRVYVGADQPGSAGWSFTTDQGTATFIPSTTPGWLEIPITGIPYYINVGYYGNQGATASGNRIMAIEIDDVLLLDTPPPS